MVDINKASYNFNKFDTFVSYIPIASTFMGAWDLFEKSVILPKCSRMEIETNHYYKRVDETSYEDILIRMVPIVGNILFGLKNHKHSEALARVEKNGMDLQHLPEFNDDYAIVAAATKQNPLALQWASEKMRSNKGLVLRLMKTDPRVLHLANAELRNDPDLSDFEHRFHRLFKLNEAKDFLPNYEYPQEKFLAFSAVIKEGSWLDKLPPAFKKDEEVALTAIASNAEAFHCIDSSLKKDSNFILKALKANPDIINYIKD